MKLSAPFSLAPSEQPHRQQKIEKCENSKLKKLNRPVAFVA
jgi:hypothetical protein